MNAASKKSSCDFLLRSFLLKAQWSHLIFATRNWQLKLWTFLTVCDQMTCFTEEVQQQQQLILSSFN